MLRISICYGQPNDPDAFNRHYDTVHVPLARAVPGLASFVTGKCRSLSRSEPPYYMVATLSFADADSMKAALRSPEMAACSADVATFATGGVAMYSFEEVDRG